MTPYATMIAVREAGGLRFVIGAYATANARTEPTIAMFRDLLGEADDSARLRQPPGRRILFIQYDDRNHHDIGSVAYCRLRGEAPAVQLVPDTFFFLSRGYQLLREAAASKALPTWQERQDTIFWRGRPTNNGTAVDGSQIERIDQIPRVVLCRALRGQASADAAIMGSWGFSFAAAEMIAYLTQERIFRPGVAMPQHAKYRYLIDIDGVASAWSFFEKLLLGGCVLKIGSPFEQWYYADLAEWRHFVPIRADFSDLAERIDWCREHPRQAREIAEEGQRFALEHDFQTARRAAIAAIGRSLLVVEE